MRMLWVGARKPLVPLEATVSFMSMTSAIPRQICFRALVCNDVTTDLMIVLVLTYVIG